MKPLSQERNKMLKPLLTKIKLRKNTVTSIALILMLTAAIGVPLITQNTTIVAAQTTSNSNLLQYEWPDNLEGTKTIGWRVGGGPAPSSQDVIWNSKLGYPLAAFNGKVFLSGGRAVDPFTGASIYNGSFGTPTKINDQYFYSDKSVYETATGRRVYGPYSVSISKYDPAMGMFWTKDASTGGGAGSAMIYGWSWPDVSQPPVLAWQRFIQKNIGSSNLIIGDGKVLVGTLECTAMALDAKTGGTLWETPIKGYLNYDGAYYQGKWVHASQQGVMYCFDVKTGKILWEFNPGTFFSYWAYVGAIYDGKVYSINTDNYVYALDLQTGKPVWTWKTIDGGVGYQTYTIAGDGKVYAYTGRADYTDANTGEPYHEEYVCLNAKTGECLWKTTSTSGSSRAFGGPPSIYNILAYGNLYLGDWRGSTIAYGPPQQWASFQGNPQNTGDGKRNGPTNLELKWIFNADSAILSSPTASEGKIYIGSTNGTFYALNYSTGNPVWQFKTDGSIKSNSALENGKVFFVSDDGYTYCLDTKDGSQVWKKYIGADIPFFYQTLQRRTASPTVVDGKVYVGSRNFTFFCLNAANGQLIWNFNAGGLISNNPAVSNGAVYVSVGGLSALNQADTGGDNGKMYKLDATTGNKIWEVDLPYSRHKGTGQLVGRQMFGSPVVGDGVVFQSGNAWLIFAINASTGNRIWTFNSSLNHDIITGALPNTLTPVYANGKLYVQDFFRIACLNASNGTKIWDQWLGHAVHGGPIYADGKIYVASELKSMYVLNSETGQKLDSYDWQDFCWSSPAIYENKLYWGTLGMKIYCFEQAPYGIITTYAPSTPSASVLPLSMQAPNLSLAPSLSSTVPNSSSAVYLVIAAASIIAAIATVVTIRKLK
jgi:outer membrane protein assembly factor BamB